MKEKTSGFSIKARVSAERVDTFLGERGVFNYNVEVSAWVDGRSRDHAVKFFKHIVWCQFSPFTKYELGDIEVEEDEE
jgi:hypothetical protein